MRLSTLLMDIFIVNLALGFTQQKLQNLMHHRKTKSVKVLPSKPHQNSIFSPQFVKIAKDSHLLPSLSNQKQQSLERPKSIFETEIPIDIPKKQTFSLARNENPENMYQKQVYQNFYEKLKFLKVLKDKIKYLNENSLHRMVKKQILYVNQGQILLQIWNDIQLFCQVSQQNRSGYLKMYEKLQKFNISHHTIRGLTIIGNVCKFKIAEYQRQIWKNKQKKIDKSQQQLSSDMNNVKQRLIKIPDAETRTLIASSMQTMNGMHSLSNKKHYSDWKNKALDYLSRNGHTKCELLRAEVFTQLFTVQ